jgi:hypothetical protein
VGLVTFAQLGLLTIALGQRLWEGRSIARSHAWCVVLLALVAGCGGETLDDIGRGLSSAAKSKKTFDALTKADDLEAQDKAVVNAFCSVATQLANNDETADETAFWTDVKQRARDGYGLAGGAVAGPADKLRALLDLSAASPYAAVRYAKACR